MYLRCSVITKGRQYFEETLKNPHLMIKDYTFEALLSIASEGYRRRTGKKFEYTTDFDYETYSNIEGWN